MAIIAVDTWQLDYDIFGAPVPIGSGGGITIDAQLWKVEIFNVEGAVNRIEDLSPHMVGGMVDYRYDRGGGIAGNVDGTALSAQITLDQPFLVTPLRDFIQPIMILNFDDGRPEKIIPLGIYIVDRPVESHTETTAEATYECRDLTYLLGRHFPANSVNYPIGSNFGDIMQSVMNDAGIALTNIRATDRTFGRARTHKRTMSSQGFVNRLAHAIGWYRVFAELDGYVTTLPYRKQGTIKPVATITDADPCNVLEVQPIGEVANVVLLTADNPAGGRAFFTRAENDDPQDPLSTVNLQRTIVYSGDVIQIEDISTQADLDAIGETWLEEARSAEQTVILQVPPDTPFGILRTVDLLMTGQREHLAGRYSMRGFSIGFAPRTDASAGGSFAEPLLTMELNRLVPYGQGAGESAETYMDRLIWAAA